jgi:hypothetical protein
MLVRPRADRQYPSQLAVAREPTGSVGRHRSSKPRVTVTAQYLALSAGGDHWLRACLGTEGHQAAPASILARRTIPQIWLGS